MVISGTGNKRKLKGDDDVTMQEAKKTKQEAELLLNLADANDYKLIDYAISLWNTADKAIDFITYKERTNQ